MLKPSVLIYIHGFNSSPASDKAQIMKQYCKQHRPDIMFIAPQLPSFAQPAAKLSQELVEQYHKTHNIGLIGSSLGGYLSVWLSEQFKIPAVLVNPAVRPYELFDAYLGEQTNYYTGETYILETHHIDELKNLYVPKITEPKLLWLLQQKGDELLDYRKAQEHFAHAKQTIEEGGNHRFVGFDRYPQQIIDFLAL